MSAEIRQSVVDSLYQTLDVAKHGWLFPTFLIEAVENEVWKHPRALTHNTVPPMGLADFIKRPYPVGLGTKPEIIARLIVGNEKAMMAWEAATGAPRTATDPAAEIAELRVRVAGMETETAFLRKRLAMVEGVLRHRDAKLDRPAALDLAA
jgi:hypothetical protein